MFIMSRKRYNKPANPEVEKEYKDMDLVNETNEEEVIEEKDTETFGRSCLSSKRFYDLCSQRLRSRVHYINNIIFPHLTTLKN